MTNQAKSTRLSLRDRPVRDHFARFLGFFLAAVQEVRSILRRTPSRLGCGFGDCAIA